MPVSDTLPESFIIPVCTKKYFSLVTESDKKSKKAILNRKKLINQDSILNQR